MKRCIKGNTFDIVKKIEADKGARKVEIAREFRNPLSYSARE